MLQKLGFVFCTLVSTTAFSATGADFIVGKIVSIAVDNDDVLVRINSGEETKTFKLCSPSASEDGINIREAFSHGKEVKASINGAFDRCLSRVEKTNAGEVSRADRPRKPSSTF